jgi:hypothetical protein
MSGEHKSGGRVAPMALAALGVVFGDIGTSPLYAVSACFTGPHIEVTPDHIFGVLSLIFWSLVLVILLKYVGVVLNADNKGEGGVLALTALVINTERASPRRFFSPTGPSRRPSRCWAPSKDFRSPRRRLKFRYYRLASPSCSACSSFNATEPDR